MWVIFDNSNYDYDYFLKTPTVWNNRQKVPAKQSIKNYFSLRIIELCHDIPFPTLFQLESETHMESNEISRNIQHSTWNLKTFFNLKFVI